MMCEHCCIQLLLLFNVLDLYSIENKEMIVVFTSPW